MLDIRVVRPVNLAKVDTIDVLTKEEAVVYSTTPPYDIPVVYRLTGSSFDRAVEVLVNGTSVSFFPKGKTSMDVVMPPRLENAIISDVFVVTDPATGTNQSTLVFDMQDTLTTARGPEKALSQFLKVLMTGQDSDPDGAGGNMRKLAAVAASNPTGLLAQVVTSVQRVVAQIRRFNGALTLPANERLAQAQVVSARVSPTDPSAVEVILMVTTQSGETAAVGLTANSGQE